MMLDLTEEEAALVSDARQRAAAKKKQDAQREAYRATHARGLEILQAAILELHAVCAKHGIGVDRGTAFVSVNARLFQAEIEFECGAYHAFAPAAEGAS